MNTCRRWPESFARNTNPRWLVALLLPLALAACGASGAGSSSVTAELPVATTTPKVALAKPQDLVLTPVDMGGGWTLVPSQTKAISLKEAVKGDPAPLLRIERPAYRSGYQVLYANFQSDGAVSQVYRYANATVAQRIYDLGVRYEPRRDPGFKPVKAPAGAPPGIAMVRGTTKQNGHTVPVYGAYWLRGRDIATIALFGKGASLELLAQLATKQDQRITAAG
jgi:hypothetical protein